MRKIILAVGAICALAGLASGRALAATDTTTQTVTITSPRNSESVLDSNVQIAGTAPAGVLVGVVIDDSDTNKSFVAHEADGSVDGSVTSDNSGHWVFTPQQTIVPGEYKVQAFFTDANGQKATSQTITFVVTNALGSSAILSRLTIWEIVVASLIIAIIIFWWIIHTVRKRRRPLTLNNTGGQLQGKADQSAPEQPLFLHTPQGREYQKQQDKKLQTFEEETRKIEHELATAAEQLEEANADVLALRHALDNSPQNQSGDDPPPKTHKK